MNTKLTTLVAAMVAVGIFATPTQASGIIPLIDSAFDWNGGQLVKKHGRHHRKHGRHHHHDKKDAEVCHGPCTGPDPEPETGPHGEPLGGDDEGDGSGGHNL